MDNQENQTPPQVGWEKEVLEKLAFAAIQEQKTARRWGIFFKLLTFGYLVLVLGIAVYPKFDDGIETGGGKHAAIIDVQGVIADSDDGTSADKVIEGLRDALENKNTKGVILNINSPGGSPVQSANIYDEIKRLKTKYPNIPIYSVVGDICASGGYYVAAASDKIFVNQASVIGSIGVLMNGFGFVNVLEKLGVERRLMTAGSHKAMLDPFSPVKSQETEHMQSLLDQVHQQFIDAVKAGRGDRLKESPDMFSGLVWTGTEGVKLGLADGFGSIGSVARDLIGTEETVNFTPHQRLLEKLAGKFGASFGHAIASFSGGLSFR